MFIVRRMVLCYLRFPSFWHSELHELFSDIAVVAVIFPLM